MSGAAKVDITPAPGEGLILGGYGGRTQGFVGIHDRIYVRALVVRRDAATAAIVCSDLIGCSDRLRATLFSRIHRETGIPPELVWLTVTHTHNAPWIPALEKEADARKAGYVNRVAESILRAVRQAHEGMRVPDGST